VLGEFKQKVLCPEDIINSGYNSLDYYSVFPGGDFTLSSDWPSCSLTEIANQLEVSGRLEYSSIDIIDNLVLSLLLHGARRLPAEIEWNVLADKLALLYIRELGHPESRQLRMKAQRANYYLRYLIDIDVEPDCEILEERHLDIRNPWDFQYIEDGEVFVGSGNGPNIYLNYLGEQQTSLRLEMPTQVDKLSDNRVAFGSCYHNGWYELTHGQSPCYYSHDRPVVLVFTKGGDEYFLDVDGGIFSKKNRKRVLRLPVRTAWRARCVGNKVFISNEGSAKSLLLLELEGWKVSLVDTVPVLLMNDLCAAPGGYYLIDKMQGRIYMFDSNFKFMNSKLAFGLGYGFLSDPVSIRMHKDNIHVLSWLGDRITVVRSF
jgi:hypothetical protein